MCMHLWVFLAKPLCVSFDVCVCVQMYVVMYYTGRVSLPVCVCA